MKLKDILTKPTKIEYRDLYDTESAKKIGEPEDFFGICTWDGKNLISGDGDSYSIEDEICGYLEMPDRLICWTKASVLNWEDIKNYKL